MPCKFIVFDLDGTLWDPEMYEVSCKQSNWKLPGGSPFRPVTGNNGVCTVKDRKNCSVNLMGKSQEILSQLFYSYPDIKMGWVSTCDYPPWAEEILGIFTTTKGHPLKQLCFPDASLIYNGCRKTDHFTRLLKSHPDLKREEILFFDNQMNNIRDVGNMGIKCVYCPDGMTKEAWRDGRTIFPDLPELVL